MAVVILISRLAGRPSASKIETCGALDHHHIAVFQIGDAIGEGRQREGVGAEIGFLVGIAHRQRRALARADQQAFMVLEDHRQE